MESNLKTNYKTLLYVAVGLCLAAIGIILYASNKTFEKIVDTMSGLNLILSVQHESFIKDLHPVHQNRFRAFIRDVEASGWKVIITSGYRSWQRQAELKRQNSKNASPGRSRHNYGLAIDINAQSGSTFLRKASSRDAWMKSGIVAIAEKHGLKWGGNFSNYWDPIHFEVPISMDLLVAQATKQFGSDPKKVIGNKVNLA